ncbi:NADP-reducing hydrogenase subunit HndC [uncultured Pleomorphomonas sp.]|uniref:NADP-reducing hydrogenase subunit HndC n=1 Tax=uncultured Pleomorphomonas sp. TaxID=442121 RepID=A0A212LHC2_9HYPH|nr:NADH-dependent [FeFe] hydrogenase, group A6 [uncultured Pleomorphomonas sp.]SCM76961.1 NADP-reducing hydrogenase subunit HndC [uncultured Pleomorphomonas sp.]
MTDMINATINGVPVEVAPGTTILDAARKAHVKIPTLCKHPDLEATGACGICIVKVKNTGKMLRSCCTPIDEGMDILTETPEIVEVRRGVLELTLSRHPNECLTCLRNQNCELQALAADFGMTGSELPSVVPDLPLDTSTRSIVLDPRKCVLCGRCITVCQQHQNVWALSFLNRGFKTRIAAAGDIPLADSPCVRCGQCSAHCPTGAIVEYDETVDVWNRLQDPDAYCVVQIAPAVRVAVGEAFGFPMGANLTGKIYASLRRMGFKAVFDTNFGADLTIIEEAAEFKSRLLEGTGALPLITSCCPGWVDFMEKFHGDMIDHFSSCKSPHEMVGVLSKTYYAEKMGIDPARIFVVSVMPCTAKKSEIIRSKEMSSSGYQDVDVSLTTREFARMIKQSGIDFVGIPEEQPDHMLGAYTGAGTIFGATGGVMEAALRTAHYYVTGEDAPRVDFEMTRGLKGVKEGKLTVAGKEIRVAVAHGLANVEQVLEKVRTAREAGEELPYHFIEVMACAGGCVGGGGQPYGATNELRTKRAAGLYQEDQAGLWRCSHHNPYIKELYADFLGDIGSHKAHDLLHTGYQVLPEYKR